MIRALQRAGNSRNLSLILMVCLLLLVAFMILYPVGMVFFGSVRDSSPGASGNFSLNGYTQAYAKASTYAVLWTSLWLSVVRTFLAVVVAIFLAWLVARTDIPHKRFLELSLLFAFFMPSLPRIMAWILMLSPRTGLINVFLKNNLPFDFGALNIFSYGGIIWVGFLASVPILYIFIAPAFKAMDANLEDSAKMSGANLWTTITRIDLPLLSPAILATTALGFVRTMESFDVEAMLGIRAGIYVFSTQIYNYVAHSDPPQYPAGMALAVMLLLITVSLVILQWRLLRGKQYTTVSGKAFRARPIELARWRWVAFASAIFFIALSSFLPLAVLLWASFTKIAGVFMPGMYTLDHYGRAFGDRTLWTAIRNTIVMATSVATIGMALCSLIGYVVVKTKFFGRRPLDLIVWIPWAVPSVVLALGFLWGYLFLPLPFRIYGTLLLMVVVLITKGFPLGTRTMTSTIVQISDDLEESARVFGASWFRAFRYVLAPLLSRGLLAGWILLFAFAVKDLSIVILLYSSKSSVIATQIFAWWSSGNFEEALILGLFEAILIATCFIVTQSVGSRVVGHADI